MLVFRIWCCVYSPERDCIFFEFAFRLMNLRVAGGDKRAVAGGKDCCCMRPGHCTRVLCAKSDLADEEGFSRVLFDRRNGTCVHSRDLTRYCVDVSHGYATDMLMCLCTTDLQNCPAALPGFIRLRSPSATCVWYMDTSSLLLAQWMPAFERCEQMPRQGVLLASCR